jgi:predicted HicB family RNase H-like nuclease
MAAAKKKPRRVAAVTSGESGESAPPPEMQRFIMRMPKELHRQLRFLSVDRGVSLNSMIVETLERWWKAQPEHGKFPG